MWRKWDTLRASVRTSTLWAEVGLSLKYVDRKMLNSTPDIKCLL